MIDAFRLRYRTLMIVFAMLALLARAAIPAGWMPSANGRAIAISVCSGEGRAVMWLDKTGRVHKSDPGQSDQHDSPCAFASAAGTAAVPLNLVQSLAIPVQMTLFAARHIFVPGQGLPAPPPPQTGPPLLI